MAAVAKERTLHDHPIKFSYTGHEQYTPYPEHFTCTFLRTPVDRAISLYTYISTRRDHHQFRQVSRMTFQQYVREVMDEGYVKFFSRDRKLDTAKKNIDEIDYIGETGCVFDDTREILRLAGFKDWEKITVGKANSTSWKKNFNISQADHDYINAKGDDLELYLYAMEKRKAQKRI